MPKKVSYFQQILQFTCSGRGTLEITHDIQSAVQASKIAIGLCHVFVNTCEGEDDMPAHVRSVITQTELTLPMITQGKLDLGAWQGVYLWKHRHRGHQRKTTLTLHGCND